MLFSRLLFSSFFLTHTSCCTFAECIGEQIFQHVRSESSSKKRNLHILNNSRNCIQYVFVIRFNGSMTNFPLGIALSCSWRVTIIFFPSLFADVPPKHTHRRAEPKNGYFSRYLLLNVWMEQDQNHIRKTKVLFIVVFTIKEHFLLTFFCASSFVVVCFSSKKKLWMRKCVEIAGFNLKTSNKKKH